MKRMMLLGCFLLSTAGTYAADQENKQAAEKNQLEIELTDEERRAVVSEKEEEAAQRAFFAMFAYKAPELITAEYLKACADTCFADIRPKIAVAEQRKRTRLLAQTATAEQPKPELNSSVESKKETTT